MSLRCGGIPEAMALAPCRAGQSLVKKLTELSTQGVVLVLLEAGFHMDRLQGKHELNIQTKAPVAQSLQHPENGSPAQRHKLIWNGFLH